MNHLRQIRARLARLIASGGRVLMVAANALANVGAHLAGRCTFTASGALVKYTLVQFASAGVVIARSTGVPAGVTNGGAADGQEVGVTALGGNDRTLIMTASGAIAAGDYVIADTVYVKTLPASGGGTGYIVGQALTATTAAGDLVEVAPCVPVKVTITS